ncbi:hypothetical protein MJ561_26555 [Klebsiella pneumoniae]|nr:hypothetical protein MJ561_26555 [Klebsiella pneumoniae]
MRAWVRRYDRVRLVDRFKVEAGGGTQLNNGWHVEQENHGVLIWLKATVARDDGLHAVLSPLRLFPGLGCDRRHTGVLSTWPLKLKPLTVGALSTLAFSLCRW